MQTKKVSKLLCPTWGEGCGLDSERGPRSSYSVAGVPPPPSGADAQASGPPRHSPLQRDSKTRWAKRFPETSLGSLQSEIKDKYKQNH